MSEAIEPSVTEEVTEESTGLLDEATKVEEAVTENPQAAEIDHRDPEELKAKEEFGLNESEDDDEPLVRPDYWPENFWDEKEAEPDLEGIAKSWLDLRKQISQGKHKVPEKYDTSAFGDTPEDDALRTHVLSWAKENGVNQAGLDSLVGAVVDMNAQNTQELERNNEEQRKMLGPNAQARIDSTDRWLSGLSQKGVLSEEDLQEARYMGGTAQGISIFEKIRASYEGRVPVESAPVEGAPSKDELYQLVGDERYATDPVFRAKVEKAFQQNF